MKKIICTALLSGMLTVQAAALPEMGALYAKSAALYAANGQELYVYNADEQLQPASVTKIMTMLLAMEALDEGRIRYDDTVTVSAYAASMGGSQVFLSEGEQITVEDLFKAICVASGNDASVAMAEHIAGVTELFVEQMNARAKQLGMNDTHFVNCTGLPAEGHVTSAWDIALMSRELILHHPDIRRFTTIWMDTIRNGAFQLANTNKLIRFYDGATGLKTGYTASAGYCISATAEREGMELIAVVLKSPSGQQRFEDAKALLNCGFSTYGLVHASPEEPLPPVPVQLGAQGTVQPRVDPAEGLLLAEKSRLQGLEQTVTLPESAEAPVRQGDVLGTLTVTQNGETVLEVPIRAAETVEKLTFGQMLLRLARTMCFCG